MKGVFGLKLLKLGGTAPAFSYTNPRICFLYQYLTLRRPVMDRVTLLDFSYGPYLF